MSNVQHSNLRSNPRAHGFSTGGSVTSNRHTISNDSRKNKDLPRSPRSAATRHSAAKSPSPPDSLEQQLDEREGISSGLVISNRQQDSSLSNDLDEEVDGVMEDFKKEEEETLSFLIDSRLLHKDFIVDKFTLALVYFRKVSLPDNGLTSDHSVLLLLLLGWESRYHISYGIFTQILKVSGQPEGEQIDYLSPLL